MMNRYIPVLTLLTITLILLAGCNRLVIPAYTSSSEIALKSTHGLYIIALDESEDWSLKQESELTRCGWFTQYELDNGKVALETCHGRFVTAQRRGGTELEDWKHWELWQDSGLGDCGQFYRREKEGKVAFETCAGKYFTPGDDSWGLGLEWSVVAETDDDLEWEYFAIQSKP